MTELERFVKLSRVGARVRYIPPHAHGDPCHPDCEDGCITAFGERSVFVRFDRTRRKLELPAEACDPADLRIFIGGLVTW